MTPTRRRSPFLVLVRVGRITANAAPGGLWKTKMRKPVANELDVSCFQIVRKVFDRFFCTNVAV